MANYTGGGGGGGASVVPATLVVADDREDYPLTQTGLVDALTELATLGGGDIYLGEGDLSLTATLTILANTRIHGSCVGGTTVTVASGVTAFNLGNFSLTLEDLHFTAGASAGSKLINITVGSDLLLLMNRVTIGTSVSDGVEVMIDGNNFSRKIKISDCTFFIDGPGTSWLYDAAASGDLEMSNVTARGEAAMDSGPTVVASNCTIVGGAASVYALGSRFSGCFLNSVLLTFGNQCLLSSCGISADTTLTFGNVCNLAACSIGNAAIFGSSCEIASTLIQGNSTFGASCAVTASSLSGTVSSATLCQYDGCVVAGAFTATGNAVDIANCVFAGALTVLTTSNVSGGSCAGAVITGTSCNVSGMTMTSTLTLGASSTLSSCTITGNSTTGNTCNLSSCAFAGTLTVGNTCNWGGGAVGNFTTGTSCNISGLTVTGTLTAGASSTFSACTITSTAAPAASCSFSGCTIGGAVTVSGASTKFSNCGLVSFSSTSLNSHEIVNCSFSGGGNNITLASSSSCQVHGNVGAQVVESGSSDSNTFSSIAAGSTLIGASSVVTDAQKFVFTSPGTLTTTDNALFARIPVQVTQGVRLLSVEVETAPTGANLIIEFKIGTRSTGALAAAFATLTLTAGAFTASTTVAAITITSSQFLVVAITQVGSTIPGSNATIVARA